jgi:hypothetical protein
MPNVPFLTLQDVPEELQPFAKEVEGGDGNVVVNVVAQEKLNEFRDNNIAVLKERDELKTKNSTLEGIVGDDTDKFTDKLEELRSLEQRVKDGQLSDSTDIEEAIQKRTSQVIDNYDEQIKKVREESALWRGKAAEKEALLRQKDVERAITDAVLSPNSGARTDALPDILTRAFKVFSVEDGKVLRKDGESTVYGSDGISPLTPLEWLTTDLKGQASYLFKDSSGGGAGGGETLQGGATRESLEKMSAMERLEYANANKLK